MKKSIKKYIPNISNMLEEPAVVYHITPKYSKAETLVKDFTYKYFKKILNKGAFTLGEWADMLFMSERTLHRYAKDDGGFNGLQIERILLLEILIDMGNEMFGKEGFKTWLQSKPFSLNGDIAKNKLNTHNGIQEIIDTLGRIQHGISA
ncbi:hypothetical protein [Niabella ginsengisoli]|uniref:DUF2384 domain-containing protein n=1 Tax=Niabella ginsengisoli TaxID=522298 RepID=A0ABS9SIK7_9BACT|nr:hypothetical protein [Niabella ginsengisoli]MCH5598165.1 hypothetical protein [Niabella ginsengisoli]